MVRQRLAHYAPGQDNDDEERTPHHGLGHRHTLLGPSPRRSGEPIRHVVRCRQPGRECLVPYNRVMEKASWRPGRVVTILAGLVLVAIIAAVVAPILAHGNPATPKKHCLYNMKQISTATAMYRQDWSDRMPLENWIDGLYPYTKSREVTDCPLIKEEKKHFGYAMKFGLPGVNILKEKEPEHTAMYFETDALGKSVIANLAARSGRHNGGSNVGYMDTHGKFKRLGDPVR